MDTLRMVGGLSEHLDLVVWCLGAACTNPREYAVYGHDNGQVV